MYWHVFGLLSDKVIRLSDDCSWNPYKCLVLMANADIPTDGQI